jgi:ribosome-binding protein aMBF1 (putative translation factor)
VCRICGRPIKLETAKTDGNGNAVHEECYGSDGKENDGSSDHPREWKIVADEVAREQNPKRLSELITELNRALDEQRLDGTRIVKRDLAPKPKEKEEQEEK